MPTMQIKSMNILVHGGIYWVSMLMDDNNPFVFVEDKDDPKILH